MVPLSGAFVRLLCKCLLLLSTVFFFYFWSSSHRNQSSVELGQLERRLTFTLSQVDSLRTQIEVITRHKEKIEHLLDEQREHFAKQSEDQEKRILHLEAENKRLSKINSECSNSGTNLSAKDAAVSIGTGNKNSSLFQHNAVKSLQQFQMDSAEKRVDDPFEGHQIRMPPMPKEEKIGTKSDFKNGTETDTQNGGTGRDAIGAEKDYIFAREKPREDLVFSRRSNDTIGMLPPLKRERNKKG